MFPTVAYVLGLLPLEFDIHKILEHISTASSDFSLRLQVILLCLRFVKVCS
jgi:hypothetical protein